MMKTLLFLLLVWCGLGVAQFAAKPAAQPARRAGAAKAHAGPTRRPALTPTVRACP